MDDSISTAADPTDISAITVQENNQPQEGDSNSPHSLLTELSHDFTRTDNRLAPVQSVEPVPVQSVEPVIGLTTEEQHQSKENPNLTLKELLSLSSCKDHISTPSTLDRLYVNQPNCFLPLAQEAKKLAQKIKAEEEASQWSGIPVEQLLNSSFNEQLNCIQSPQQITPLHAAKDQLPKGIITILDR